MSILLAMIFQFAGVFLIFGSVYYAIFFADHQVVHAHIIHMPSALIVFVGLIGVLFSTTHYKEIWELLKVFFLNSPSKVWNQVTYVEENFDQMTTGFYKDGAPGIRKTLDSSKTAPIWNTVIEQLEAKVDPLDIRTLVQRNFFKVKENYQHKIKTMEMLVSSAPSLGMFGTVLGLIKLLAGLSDYSTIGPNMSLALITTLYGIFASLLLNPLVKQIENKFRKVSKSYEQVLFWLDFIKEKKPGFFLTQEYGKR